MLNFFKKNKENAPKQLDQIFTLCLDNFDSLQSLQKSDLIDFIVKFQNQTVELQNMLRF